MNLKIKILMGQKIATIANLTPVLSKKEEKTNNYTIAEQKTTQCLNKRMI